MTIHQLGTMVGSVFQDPRSQFFATNTTDEIALGMENIPLARRVMRKRVEAVCAQMNIGRLLDRRIFHLSAGKSSLSPLRPSAPWSQRSSSWMSLRESGQRRHGAAGRCSYRLKAAGHTIILSEQPVSIMCAIPSTGLFL